MIEKDAGRLSAKAEELGGTLLACDMTEDAGWARFYRVLWAREWGPWGRSRPFVEHRARVDETGTVSFFSGSYDLSVEDIEGPDQIVARVYLVTCPRSE